MVITLSKQLMIAQTRFKRRPYLKKSKKLYNLWIGTSRNRQSDMLFNFSKNIKYFWVKALNIRLNSINRYINLILTFKIKIIHIKRIISHFISSRLRLLIINRDKLKTFQVLTLIQSHLYLGIQTNLIMLIINEKISINLWKYELVSLLLK